MSFNQKIVLNFPATPAPYYGKMRELFHGYGFSTNFDATESSLEDGSPHINIEFDRVIQCDKTNLALLPSTPSRCLKISSNSGQGIVEGKSTSDREKKDRDIDDVLKFLANFPFYAKRSRNESEHLLRDKMSELQNQTECIRNGVKKENKAIKCIQGIYNKYGQIFGDYSLAWKMGYNPMYAGGCVSFQPIEDSSQVTGVIAYPTGKFMNEITCRGVAFDNQSQIVLDKGKTEFKYDMEEEIDQVTSTTTQGEIIYLSRTKKKFSLFTLNGSKELIHESAYKCPDNEELTYVSHSPHLKGECLVASSNGTVQLWSLQSQRQLYQVPIPTDPLEGALANHATHCHFTSHRWKFMVTTTNSITIVDARTPKPSSLINLSENKDFHENERITCSFKPTHLSSHLLFGSQLGVYVVDDRFPKHLILRWNHSLLSPVTLMDSMDSVMDVDGETLLAFGCQDPGEIHFLQMHHVGTPYENLKTNPSRPQICGLPWIVGGMIPSNELKRIRMRSAFPRIGFCLVPNQSSKGVSVIELTSAGDLFCQDFHSDHTRCSHSKAYTGSFVDRELEKAGCGNEEEDLTDDNCGIIIPQLCGKFIQKGSKRRSERGGDPMATSQRKKRKVLSEIQIHEDEGFKSSILGRLLEGEDVTQLYEDITEDLREIVREYDRKYSVETNDAISDFKLCGDDDGGSDDATNIESGNDDDDENDV